MAEGQAGAEIPSEMAAAGAAAYRVWESDERERAKLNGVANLVCRVYRAMEAQRLLDSRFS